LGCGQQRDHESREGPDGPLGLQELRGGAEAVVAAARRRLERDRPPLLASAPAPGHAVALAGL